MAYAATNPPVRVFSHEAAARGMWMYVSADAEAAFDDTDYITNARAIGMKTGDFVFVIDTTNGLSTIAQVTVDSDGNGTLSALTAIS